MDKRERAGFGAAMENFDTFHVMLMVREAMATVIALQEAVSDLSMDPNSRQLIRAVGAMLEVEIMKRHPELKDFLARGWKLG